MDNEDADEQKLKRVAFYQTFLSAWTENRMEKDKQVLTLSGLAIGLLTTLRSETDSSAFAFFVWILAGLSFISSIVLILRVFRKNTDYIETLLSDENQSRREDVEKELRCHTYWANWLFVIGVVLTLILVARSTEFVTQCLNANMKL